MNQEQAIEMAWTMIEDMMIGTEKRQRVEITRENGPLIAALKEQIASFGGFASQVIGVVGGKKWFVFFDTTKSVYDEKKAGQLILVDFKARKVIPTPKVA